MKRILLQIDIHHGIQAGEGRFLFYIYTPVNLSEGDLCAYSFLVKIHCLRLQVFS